MTTIKSKKGERGEVSKVATESQFFFESRYTNSDKALHRAIFLPII